MENGIAIIQKTDKETKGVFIDRETIEYARLNARIKKRIADTEAAQRKTSRKLLAAANAIAQRKAYTRESIGYILIRCCTIGAATWAGIAGFVHPVICAALSLFCLCTACVRLGAWLGRGRK